MAAIDLAVIGYGFMSSGVYCPLLHAVADRVRLCGLVEPDGPKRETAMRLYHFACAVECVEDLLARERPQAALVLTPAATHPAVIGALLEAGVDVYTEKPDALRLEDARRLVELARARRCVYQVGQNRLFLAAVRKAKEFLADRPVDFIHVEKSKAEHRTTPEYLIDDGCHVVSPLLHLAGDVAQVESAVHIPGRMLSAAFRLASGGAATLVQHVDSGYWVERFLIHASGRSVNVVTPDGIERFEGGVQQGDGNVGRVTMLFNPASLWGFQAALSHFLDCVESRQEPIGSARSLLRVHELMNEVFRMAGLDTL